MGHQNTFKILTADTNKVMCRSRVRVPKDVPNIRAISLLPGWKPESASELSEIDPAVLEEFIHTPRTDPNTTTEEVDLEAKPTVETVSEDEEKEVERDDKQHPHVRPSPVQFLSDKTGKIIPLEDEQLLNRQVKI